MKPRLREALLGLLAAFIITISASAQITPPYDWKMFETEHFRIIFHSEVEGLAYEAAEAAEEAYKLWSELLKTTPPAKTDIVVIDNDDSPNGFADSQNLHSWEFASQVQFSTFFGGRVPSNIGDTVFHEYYHIADINAVSGFSQNMRSIFGRNILPNDIKPIWSIEGPATYSEYYKYGYSRATWALSAMYMRQMALDNSFPSLDRAAGPFSNTSWPSTGTLWYILGSWFTRYIQDEHSMEALAKISALNANNWLSSLSYVLAGLIQDNLGIDIYIGPDFGNIVTEAVGVPIKDLYSGFQSWLKTQAKQQVERVIQTGMTPSDKLTTYGYYSGQPEWSPKGDKIAYEHSEPFRRGGIRVIDPQGNDRYLTAASFAFDGALDWSPDGQKLVYSHYDQNGPYMNVDDLYWYDFEKSETLRLTNGARAYSPSFTPDGKAIIFGQAGPGDHTSISKYDMETKAITVIKSFPEDTFLDFVDVSPDGTQLALSVWKRPGFSDIYLMPAAGGDFVPVTQDDNEDFRPTWSPDGQYILFDSVRDETFNLFAVRLSDNQIFQITNVVSGAISASVAPDSSQIVFVSYGSTGYDLHLMEYDPATWKAVSFPQQILPAWGGFPKPNFSIEAYNPWVTMLPKYWQPSLTETTIGARTDSWDALYRHYYSLDAGYDLSAQGPYGSLYYLNQEHLAPVTISLSAGLDPYGNWQSLGLEYSPTAEAYRQHTMSLSLDRADYDGVTYSLSASSDYSETFGEDLSWGTLTTSSNGTMNYDPATRKVSGEFTLSLKDLIHLPVIDRSGPHELVGRINMGASGTEGNFSIGGTRGMFMVRGQPRGVLAGSQAAAWSVEYRFPVVSIERGLGLMPFFLDDIRGAFFIDGGLAWDEQEAPEEDAGDTAVPPAFDFSALHRIGYGAELRVMFVTGFGVQRSIRVGVAYGQGQTSPSFYWGFGTAF